MKRYFPILFVFTILSCTTSTYDDIEEIQDENPGELVTYQEIASIFQNNCTVCHSNPPQSGAPMPLTNYTEVKIKFQINFIFFKEIIKGHQNVFII